MPVPNNLASPGSVAAEIEAAEAWRDSLGPETGARFSVRRRDTHEPVPIDQVSPEAYDQFEIVFTPEEGEQGEPAVWQPMSRKAFEMLFIE